MGHMRNVSKLLAVCVRGGDGERGPRGEDRDLLREESHYRFSLGHLEGGRQPQDQ